MANHFVFDRPAGMEQINGWSTSWLIFAGYALVVAILFWIFFRTPHADKVNTTDNKACKIDEAAEGSLAGSEI